MGMQRRSWRGFWAMGLAALMALGGCSGKNPAVHEAPPEEARTVITFFGNKYEPENVTVIEEIISGFMKENPTIRVSYESLKGRDYYEALRKRMAAGKGDDVFIVDHDTVLELEAQGQLADLSGLSCIASYDERMLGQMREQGKIYWVPTTVSAFGLYCNLDLLRQHGQRTPENLQEWEQVCSYFVQQGITPIIVNNDISLKTVAIGRSFYALYQEDRQRDVFGRLNSGQASLSQALRPGFALVKGWLDQGYIEGDAALETQKTSDDLEAFARGESPFLLTGAWAAGRVKGMEPGFAFEVAPYPILEDGALVVINADTRLSVNANSRHPEAAKRFVEYFTRMENIQRFADQQSSFSPLQGGAPSAAEEIQPLINCYAAGRVVIGADGLLDLPIWDWTAEASKKLLGGQSLDEVMGWLEEQARGEGGTLS